MEYKQIYQRLSEEPLGVLEQVFHNVSEIYQSCVQRDIQDSAEQKRSKEAAANDEPESGDDDERSSTAHSNVSCLAGSENVLRSDFESKDDAAPTEDRYQLPYPSRVVHILPIRSFFSLSTHQGSLEDFGQKLRK